MAKTKRKRKPQPHELPDEQAVGSVSSASTPPQVDEGSASAHELPAEAAADSVEVRSPFDAPITTACNSCHAQGPHHANFCWSCGEPQRSGLQRPVYVARPAEESPPSRPPAPVVVPSVPRVTPRTSSPVLIPSLSVERPIPASLLQPGAPASPVVKAQSGPTATGSPAAMKLTTAGSVAASSRGAAASHPHASSPFDQSAPDAAAPLPLFDASTEARILGLRTAHEMTLERFERLMVGFKLKPKPKPRAVPAKSKEASKDKAEKKPKEKAAKGH